MIAAAGSAHETQQQNEAQKEADRIAAEQDAERTTEAARIQADIDEAERIAFEEAAEANRLEQEAETPQGALEFQQSQEHA